MEETVLRDCDLCSNPYDARRASSRYCGSTCRARASRRRAAGEAVPSVRREASGVTDATRAWLEAKGVAGTALGAVALVLANRIDEAIVTPVSGTTLAAMSRELRATLRELEKVGVVAPDVLDELKARCKARLGGTRQR